MSRLILATMVLALGIAGGLGPTQAQMLRTPDSREQIRLSFAPIVRQVAPAVVNVYGARVVQSPMAAYRDDPMFRRFFGDRPAPERDRVQASLGSGVIVDASGLVVTNHHVIANVDEVKVQLGDKREFEADVVLRDPRTDLAVLRIRAPGERFSIVELGDSDALEVGDLVLAIGNPFGVGQTVTQGIVSALARTQVGVSDYQFFVQTDAAINPGNSGGALVGMDGRLVGINTAIFSRSGGNHGIGFAIPAAMVRVVVESALAGGQTVRRPYFGARLQTVSPDIAEGLGLSRPNGALVVSVVARSPADRAGVRRNDIILKLDGQDITDPDAFGFRYATKHVGQNVEMEILRQNERRIVSVPLETAPETRPRDAWTVSGRVPFSGAIIGNLSPALAEELRVDVSAEGVAVIEVGQGSPAQALGLRRGDIVRTVNGEAIPSVQALRAIIGERARLWRIQIERDGRVLTTVVGG